MKSSSAFRLPHSAFLLLLAAGVAFAQTMPMATSSTQPGPKSPSPIAPGAVPIKLAEGFAFTEGATCDKEGNVCFIDQPNDRIMQWTFDGTGLDPTAENPHGAVSVFLHPSGYSNGMSFDEAGNLISCADEKNELWSISPDKKITVLVKDFNGKLLNGPNDVWIVPAGPNAGGMYLTDPLYSRAWWGAVRPANDRTSQLPGHYVFYLSPDHKTLTPVVKDFRQPNGIMGTPDGKTLYASDIDGGHTYSYTIQPDGSLTDKKLFCNTGSDGMTIDDAGNIYTTHSRNGLLIWDKAGNQIDHINLACANVCFAGKNRDLLFINTHACGLCSEDAGAWGGAVLISRR